MGIKFISIMAGDVKAYQTVVSDGVGDWRGRGGFVPMLTNLRILVSASVIAGHYVWLYEMATQALMEHD